MFQKEAPDIPVVSAPFLSVAGAFQFRLQQFRALSAESINDGAGTTAAEVVELCPWPLQIATVVKPLEPPKDRLPTAVQQLNQMRGAKEPVPPHLAKNLPVTLRQLQPDVGGRTLETGKSSWGHSTSLPREEGK